MEYVIDRRELGVVSLPNCYTCPAHGISFPVQLGFDIRYPWDSSTPLHRNNT